MGGIATEEVGEDPHMDTLSQEEDKYHQPVTAN